ncbi:MAG: acetate/propionate family kinase [Candidatus Acidiferrales bacterium]
MTAPLQKRVLTMNRGSSTLKSAIYEAGVQNELLLSISVERSGGSVERLKIADPNGKTLMESAVDSGDSNAALKRMFAWLGERGFLSRLAAAGHRLVHGGPRYRDPQEINPEFLLEIEKLVPLDPDHMPAAIAGIKFIAEKFPGLPQVACFDTAFHSSLPKVARMYALPRRLYDQGIFRYGFHGLSYEYVMSELRALEGKLANGRVIIAHLGSGASMVAVKDGKSVDTSMGFTPLEGLVMSTRSGDVDPGALFYLLDQKKLSLREMGTILNKESGLLGVSGASGDMRELLGKIDKDGPAGDAVDLFCYRAKKYVGAYAAVLGGLDVLVFAGGIGENAPLIRQRICDGLDFLGIRLDATGNEANAASISSSDSRVRVRAIKTNEDLMIVRHVVSTLGWTNA